jgi:hypothetical protein
MRSGGNKRPSILADAWRPSSAPSTWMPASPPRRLVHRLARGGDQPARCGASKDPKTELQEWLQGRKMKLPSTVWSAPWAPRTSRRLMSSARSRTGFAERGIGGSRRAASRPPPRMLQTAEGNQTMNRSNRRFPPTQRPFPPAPAAGSRRAALRPDRHRGQAQRGQVHAAQCAGRPEDQHHLAQGADHAPPHHRHAHRGCRRSSCSWTRPGFQTRHGTALNRSLNRRFWARWAMSIWCCSSSRPATSPRRRQGAVAAQARALPALLVANKLDQVHRVPTWRPGCKADAAAPCVCRVRADVGQECQGRRAPVRHLRKYLPEQPGGMPRTS